MTATFGSLLAIDQALAAAGHHALTPFWRETFERLYSSNAPALVARVGRGGAKSFSSVKFALNETLAGDWNVPPGERHWFGFVSRLKEEVSQRRLLLEAFLRALNVPFESRGDVVELTDLPLGFRFFAASVAATSGFRCIGFVCDELAKWESDDGYRNPANEVVSSLAAMTITHPRARRALISSPWSLDDYHAECFSRGNTDEQIVASAPTWIANPSVTQEQTHTAEPDRKKWAREYLAEPGHTESTAFEPEDVAAAFSAPTGKLRRDWRGGLTESFVLIDASSLRGDSFAFAIGATTDAGEIQIVEVDGFEGETLRGLSMGAVVQRIAERAAKHNAHRVFGDQREEAALRELFRLRGLAFTSFAWSESSKDEAVQLLRRLMAERKLKVTCEHAKLRRELLGLKARLQPSGRISYASNGRDYVSTLITLGHALEARLVHSAVLPSHAVASLDSYRKMASNPQRVANRVAGLAGTRPVAVKGRPRACRNCRRYTLTGLCCDKPSF